MTSTDFERIKRLAELTDNTYYAEQIIGIVSDIILIVAVVALMIDLCWRKRYSDLPIRVKISLIGFTLYKPTALFFNFSNFVNHPGYEQFSDNNYHWLAYRLGETIWLSFQW